ncbi:Ig-like domain-containing protein [Nocardioides daeguensis]|uniref:Ig-like domain repeat protein n=1 Tax=Nocardioides daeguensis TaxID=908359 RepID=A0ABP6WCU0_9ACTN|nr:Ig-like domain-containing protein [Nocardioides daeguensis]MBV6727963.1 Ig-like domain-containing protein [Nocardioides daeguensis]MCR1774037.1 Ig-like domain-containing protein [Nocardioides daeguensis]
MFIASSRRLAALTAGGLASAALTAASFGAAPAHAADSVITIDKQFTYDCEPIVTIGPDSETLGHHPIQVQAQSTIPSVAYAGQTLAATPTTITLHMSNNLWLANKVLTHVANAVDGSSDDSTLGMSIDGAAPSWVPIDGLSVTNAPIPVAAEDVWTPPEPWLIPTSGTVRAIPIPADAAGKEITLHMPQQFTADALIKGGWLDNGDGVKDYQNVKTDMTCVLDQPDDTLLEAPVPIQEPTATTLSATTAPSVYGSSSKVAVNVSGAATGPVEVVENGAVLARGAVTNGTGTVPLPANLAVGTHNLTVRYPEAWGFLASSATTSVTVGKATASITSAKVAPKKVKAKKAAKLTVAVAAPAGTTGAVTVTLKGKTVGTGTLANGTATIKLKKFKKAGKQSLTVTYAGDANSTGATKTVKVKVVK